MLKVIHPRLSALLGVLFAAGCAAGQADTGDGAGGATGTGGVQGATPPPSGVSGSYASGGSSQMATGSGGASTGAGGSTPNASSGGAPSGASGSSSSSGGATASGGATGSAGKAGASSSTGGGGTAGPCTVGSGMSTVTDTGGFVSAGMWHGYAFTAKGGAGTSITPDDFAMLTAGQALCACGTVKGTTDYSGTAMIGINLNQEAGGTDVGTVTPSGMGINVTVTGAGTTPLRLQIQGPMGSTDAKQRWCADLPAAGGMIPWGNFQFECWEGGKKTPFDGMTAITAAMVLVPGGTTDIPFNFCVTALAGG
jgi:hypothetical protein